MFRFAPIAVCALTLCACAGDSLGGEAGTFTWLHEGPSTPTASRGAFAIRWSRQLTPRDDSKYVPVEYAEGAFDPGRNRIYIGTTIGEFFGFDVNGRRIFKYQAGSSIESAAAVDRRSGELFVPSMDGNLHALTPDGAVRWKVNSATAVRRRPVLSTDAIYLISEEDRIVAMSREDGSTLWSYEEERIEEMTIAGHAGLTLAGGKMFAAFNSGRVAALDPADGSVLWVFDTSTDIELSQSDIPQFFDVDTTPVVIGDTVYCASFAGGLYALDIESGTVRWHDEQLTGVTSMVRAGKRSLIIVSSRSGVSRFDVVDRTAIWTRPPERGAPSPPLVTEFGTVLYGETQGSLFALALSDGREIARAEGGYGFSAAPSAASEVGVALSNGGRLLCLRLR